MTPAQHAINEQWERIMPQHHRSRRQPYTGLNWARIGASVLAVTLAVIVYGGLATVAIITFNWLFVR